MNNSINILTIGFTGKSAEKFFELLKYNNAKKILDTRLNNTGQLAGFSKRDDLAYFSKSILGIEYFHWTESAPEEGILSAYKKKQIKWEEYSNEYLALLQKRKIEASAARLIDSGSCLLCSEAQPHMCHRSILARYLASKLGADVTVKHLT